MWWKNCICEGGDVPGYSICGVPCPVHQPSESLLMIRLRQTTGRLLRTLCRHNKLAGSCPECEKLSEA